MECFNLIYPETSLWNVSVGKHAILPEGIYAFLEFYCTNPECDCKAGFFQMVEIDSKGDILGNAIAVIEYKWGEPISEQNPQLEGSKNRPSKITQEALAMFLNSLQNEAGQIDMLKLHYKMLKDYFIENPDKFAADELITKIGRNDTCPCGSGKKYKKCCFY